MEKMKGVLDWVLPAGLLLASVVGIVFVAPQVFSTNYDNTGVAAVAPVEEFLGTTTPVVVAEHVEKPEAVKALYMTACVAGTPSWRQSLKHTIETTELNSVIIDIKDATGAISFVDESLQPAASIASGCKVRDMREFIAELHASGIYVIGRISVFQDPHYASLHPELAVKSLSTGGVWKDHKGLAFIDVGAQDYWDFIIRLSKASYNIGFDELNFDYVRYPSDGNMKDTNFTWTHSTVSSHSSPSDAHPSESRTGQATSSTVTVASTTDSTSSPQAASTTSSVVRTATRAEMLEKFFAYLHENLEDSGAVLSADLFGMVTTVESDMGIGQVLERALPYFDYIAPMVYPSHYPKGWHGYANPAAHPYDVIKIAMTRAVEREQAWRVSQGIATSTPTKMRPWLQDFNLGAVYTPEMVRAQIQATYDSGIEGWMLWDAGNTYTTSALLPEEDQVVGR